MELRAFKIEDTDGVIALIDGIYREYGDRVHLEKAEADLKDIPAHFDSGHFMVLDDGSGGIVGTVAIAPAGDEPKAFYVKRLYLHPDVRGQGWADVMIDWTTEMARDRGARRLQLWSDVRFERAHAFYTKRGFHHDGRVRTMNDAWTPYREHFYTMEL
jgi:putative acetyltransferase